MKDACDIAAYATMAGPQAAGAHVPEAAVELIGFMVIPCSIRRGADTPPVDTPCRSWEPGSAPTPQVRPCSVTSPHLPLLLCHGDPPSPGCSCRTWNPHLCHLPFVIPAPCAPMPFCKQSNTHIAHIARRQALHSARWHRGASPHRSVFFFFPSSPHAVPTRCIHKRSLPTHPHQLLATPRRDNTVRPRAYFHI